jgi:ornithine carbamoyltransferase
VLALIFDKHSTRTRISFDVGMRQLGGTTIMLSGQELQLAREETIADTARVLSRYVDAVMIRLLDHEMVRELANNATIPVINGLTKLSHPCQVMADVMTFEERGPIKRPHDRVDGRLQQCADLVGSRRRRLGFKLKIATPRNSRRGKRARMGDGRGRRGRVRRGSQAAVAARIA